MAFYPGRLGAIAPIDHFISLGKKGEFSQKHAVYRTGGESTPMRLHV